MTKAKSRAALTAALATWLAVGGLFGIGCYEKGDRENARPIAEPAPSQETRSAAEAPPPAEASRDAGGVTPPLARSHGPIIPEPTGTAGAPGAGQALPPGHPTVGGDAAGGLQWVVPKGWQETPPTSAMRRAQYRLPAAPGDPDEGECVVFYFGAGQGGNASSNVARWASMVTGPDGGPAPYTSSEMQVGGRTITRMKTAGTYTPAAMGMGGAPPPPHPDWMMLGAIAPGGDANWFFRCTGPRRTVESQEPAFDSLLKSIH